MPIRGADSGEKAACGRTRAPRRAVQGQVRAIFTPPNTAFFCLGLLYQLKCSFYGGYFDVFKNDGNL